MNIVGEYNSQLNTDFGMETILFLERFFITITSSRITVTLKMDFSSFFMILVLVLARVPIGTKKWGCTTGRGREIRGILEPLFTPKNLLVYSYTLDLISGALGRQKSPIFGLNLDCKPTLGWI